MKKFLGVLGGMGPLATADFLAKLTTVTPAKTDQAHIPVLVYGDCTIPDRTAHILGQGPSPLPRLLEGIRFLNANGARVICIPCNSAHHWHAELAAASAVPLLHIVTASAEQVRRKAPTAKKVGVLSTEGTFRMGIYRGPLRELGYTVVEPNDEEFRTLISPAIALIKSTHLPEAETLLAQASTKLSERGAEITILGCTETPIGMRNLCQAAPDRFVDSSEALARACIAHF